MWLMCPECREQSAFEQPPCADGHGLDCPEWFCVTCGSAVFVGALEEEMFRLTSEPAAPQRLSRRQSTHSAA